MNSRYTRTSVTLTAPISNDFMQVDLEINHHYEIQLQNIKQCCQATNGNLLSTLLIWENKRIWISENFKEKCRFVYVLITIQNFRNIKCYIWSFAMFRERKKLEIHILLYIYMSLWIIKNISILNCINLILFRKVEV